MKFFAAATSVAGGFLYKSFVSGSDAAVKAASMQQKEESPSFVQVYREYPLGEVINLAEDVAIFRFLLPTNDHVFDLSPCSTLQANIGERSTQSIEAVTRCYTPITRNGEKGYFDIIVKKYTAGRMTEHMFGMEIGDTVRFRCVHYKLKYMANKWREIGMLGAGTGITPLLQVVRAALDNPNDTTKLSLLFANQRQSKILLRGVLDDYAQRCPDRFRVKYCIDRPEPGWDGYVGFLNMPMVRACLPKPNQGNLVLVCGPDKFLNLVTGAPLAVLKAWSGGLPTQPAAPIVNNLADVYGLVGQLGFTKDEVYRF